MVFLRLALPFSRAAPFFARPALLLRCPDPKLEPPLTTSRHRSRPPIVVTASYFGTPQTVGAGCHLLPSCFVRPQCACPRQGWRRGRRGRQRRLQSNKRAPAAKPPLAHDRRQHCWPRQRITPDTSGEQPQGFAQTVRVRTSKRHDMEDLQHARPAPAICDARRVATESLANG